MNRTVTEYKLTAGGLEAVFLPGRGMFDASLKHRGEELLRRLENLEAAAAKGSTAGMPLLYPWANRLAVPRCRASGLAPFVSRLCAYLRFPPRRRVAHIHGA